MSINGVNNQLNTYKGYRPANKTSTKNSESKSTESKKSTDASAVYESSSSKNSSSTSKSNVALVEQLKKEQQNRLEQMQSLVTKMFEKQGVTIGNADEMWKKLAAGNFSADPETIAQAKKDISEDGYWGVTQTSDRIFSFAMALSGGDEAKMEKMKAAVEKGFKEATKSWGKELPEISKTTYDTVMGKFDDWFASNKTVTE